MLFFLAAISLGFLGSFHCLGMCGPIALSLPLAKRPRGEKLFSILLYNSGRVITYSVLGILFGLLGSGFAIFGLQQALSVTIGVLILLSVLWPKKFLSAFGPSKWAGHLFYKLKSRLSVLFSKKTFSSFFAIGLLNGLLPCGLVYMAIAASIATGSAIDGGLFMAFFGFATVPMMFSLSWISNLLSVKFRSAINKTLPYMISVMAIIMILRGMNLGIPYLSPSFEGKNGSVTCCAKPDQPDKKENVKCRGKK